MRNTLLSFSFVTLLAASTIPAIAQNFKPIKTAEDFNTLVVGKTLTWGAGSAVIRANGKTDGRLNEQGKYTGNWAFTQGFYCRNLVIKNKETGTNCQTVEIDGNKLRMTRDQGKGRATTFSMK